MASADKRWFGDPVGRADGVKKEDGTYTFTVDVSSKDSNDYVQIHEWLGNEFITINYAASNFHVVL